MQHALLADNLLRTLALAVARNEAGAMRPAHEIAAANHLTPQEYDAMSKNPQFQYYKAQYLTDLKENGFSVQAKSKILVEDLLADMYHAIKDTEQPLASRVKAFDTLVDLSDVRPKNNVQSQNTGNGFSITINFPDKTSTTIHDTETEAIEADITDAEDVTKLQKSISYSPHSPIELLEEDEYQYAGEDYYE